MLSIQVKITLQLFKEAFLRTGIDGCCIKLGFIRMIIDSLYISLYVQNRIFKTGVSIFV